MSCFVRDILYPLSIEYAILILNESIHLVRIGHRSKIDMLYRKDDSSTVSIQSFLRHICEKGLYYGQPLSILIDDRNSWSYIAKVGKGGMTVALERLRSLADAHLECRHRVIRDKGDTIFFAQSVEKTYLEELLCACAAENINVTGISTLPVALFSVPAILRRQETIQTFELPDGTVSYIIDKIDKGVVLGNSESSDLPSTISSLRNTFFEQPGQIPIETHVLNLSQNRALDQKAFGPILKNALAGIPRLRQLAFKGKDSLFALALKVAINSAKLLTSILTVLFLALALVAATTGFMTSGNDDTIDIYQQHYSHKLELESTLDSLKHESAELVARGSGSFNNATVISAFCQRRISSAYLNRILIRNMAPDSSLVEIAGAANTENAVFRYHDLLSEAVKPYVLSVNAIKPEITNSRGAADTTITFKFTMKIDADHH
ncbi:MAG: hypothetical protein AB1483_12435 [Candidatus Zixiibacteriota bacterium]